MASTTIQIRTDTEVKSNADVIFKNLGITMSDGINIFLRQVNLHGGLPFEVRLPAFGAAGFVGANLHRDASVEGSPQQNTQSYPQRREYIRSLCGKYKDSTFSTKRHFEQKRRDKAREK